MHLIHARAHCPNRPAHGGGDAWVEVQRAKALRPTFVMAAYDHHEAQRQCETSTKSAPQSRRGETGAFASVPCETGTLTEGVQLELQY